MKTLAVALIIGSIQDPAPDDIPARFPDPVPADRAWEMAAQYHQRIADAVSREHYDEARAWDRRARERLPSPYRDHLAEIGRVFWTHLAHPPRNPDHFRFAREGLLRALGVALPPPAVGENPQNALLPLHQAAWLLAFRGRFEAALECLRTIERTQPAGTWIKETGETRLEIESLQAAKDDPKKLAQLSRWIPFAGAGSHQAAFAVLRRLKFPDIGAAGLKTGAAYLKAIKDEAGARAWEDRLFGRQDLAPEELASIALGRANEAHKRGDAAVADEGYRRILKEWPRTITWGRALYNLGFSLQKQKRYPEARAEYERLLAADVNDNEPGDPIMDLRRNYRPKAIVHIGECYEAEGNWEKALEFYRKQASHPMRSFCGNCSASAYMKAELRIARSLASLGRDGEAMTILRKFVLETDGGFGFASTELAILAVDLAVRMGKVEEFGRELDARIAKGSSRRHAVTARDYLNALRLRTEGDFKALFDVLRHGIGYSQNRWEEARERSRVAVEAAECLGELGDPALDWLMEKVRSKSGDKELALIAIAHFKTPRAIEFIRGIPVRPQTNDAYFIRMLETIHAAPPRKRNYPAAPVLRQDVGFGLTGVLLSVLALLECARRRRFRMGDNSAPAGPSKMTDAIQPGGRGTGGAGDARRV